MANIFIFIITVRVSMIHSSFSTAMKRLKNTREITKKHHIVKTMTQFVGETILTENILCNEQSGAHRCGTVFHGS